MSELEVEKICKKYDIRNWTLKDGLVDVDGDVVITYKSLTRLPLLFGRVTGHFNFYDNNLTTLEGAPTEVGGEFSCYGNNLTTLEGAPTEVPGSFYCGTNKFTTLKGAPKKVDGDFSCSYNNLTTLEGAPTEVDGNFVCAFNHLISLEGSPTSVGGDFWCYNNSLITLKWAPEYIDGAVDFLPNDYLPRYLLTFINKNYRKPAIQKYIFKWQKDYAVWRRDGSFNQANFIQMMEDAEDELENIKFPK